MNKLFPGMSLIALSFVISLSGISQSPLSHSEEYSLLGLHLLLADYNKPYFNHFKAGYQLSYADNLSEKLDYMVQGGSIGSDNAFKNSNKNDEFIHYLSASILFPLRNNRKAITPFIAAGAGVNFRTPYLAPFLLPGIGFRLKVAKNTYFHTQTNYELSLHHRMNNSVQINVGVLGVIFQKSKKSMQPIPVNQEETFPVFIDSDNDGIPDYSDSCPARPGPPAFNGCPDSDGDGIPDHQDHCSTIAGHAANKGCPVSINDRDKDGIPDESDRCPDLPGTAINNGCPIINQEVEQKLKLIISNINFDVDKSDLTKSTQNALKELVLILQTYPMLLLTIGGHTDNTGNHSRNQALSKARASAVADHIIANGIRPDRVQAFGYGDAKPIADNRTKEGKASNRRTELTLRYP